MEYVDHGRFSSVLRFGAQILAGGSPGGGSGPPAGKGSSDRALSRLASQYAIALRAGSAVIYLVVGPLAATASVRLAWLTAVLLALLAWSVVFAVVVFRHGLSWRVAAADLMVVMALVSAQRHVVPAGLIRDGTTWVLPLASTSVYILQLALPPMLGIPAAGLVTAVYAASAPEARGAWILLLQAVITSGLMTLVRRGGRRADALIGVALRAEQETKAQAARRADQREAYRQIHDTILSTLIMVASGAFTGPSRTLSTQACRDLEVLDGPVGARQAAGGLCDQLRKLADEAVGVVVGLDCDAPEVPAPAASQIIASVAEALRNVARHAGVQEAEVTAYGGEGWVVVTVRDRGRGFDPGHVPMHRRGLGESIVGRMSVAGGHATVDSAPGRGTTVTLRWPR